MSPATDITRKLKMVSISHNNAQQVRSMPPARCPLQELKRRIIRRDNGQTPRNSFIGLVFWDSRIGEHRILMNVNKHSDSWDLPGGIIDRGESAWDAAIRELHEETRMVFKGKYWDFSKEVVLNIGFAQIHLSYYRDVSSIWQCKGNPRNSEVSWVECPRLSAFMQSLATGHNLKCGKITKPLRGAVIKHMRLA